jgi:nitroreductase
MQLIEAVDSRMSCRAFLDKPVAKATLCDILQTAARAPSGGNLQPWLVHALTGNTLKAFLDLIHTRRVANPSGEGAEYPVYPPNLHEPYRSRRFKCGEDLYATIRIAREDKRGRLEQFARNYEVFGAPVLLFFVIDRRMGIDQWADVGMFMQTIMLLAREHGLHTCAQEAWASWHITISEYLQLPAEQMVFCGMALGFRDEAAPINQLRTQRAALEEFATLKGFD